MTSELPEEEAQREPTDEPAADQPESASPAEPEPSVSETSAEAGSESEAEQQPVETPSVETPSVEEAPVAAEAEAGLPELTLGSGEPAADLPAEPKTPAIVRGKIDAHGVAIGTGRRKTAVARVRIRDGEGKFSVNGRELSEFFHIERDRLMVEAPLEVTGRKGKVDVWVRVNGGGTTGQTGAIVLGIARALEAMDPTLHEKLSLGGFLTRDGRMVERKKYGFKKARKSFQFSKR